MAKKKAGIKAGNKYMPTIIGLGKLYRCENCGATLTATGVTGTTGWIESRCCETDATEMTGKINSCHTCRRPYGENEAQPTDNAGMVSPCCGN